MSIRSLWRSLMLGVAAISIAACSITDSTAPKLPDDASQGLISGVTGTLTDLLTVSGLSRKDALTRNITVSADIGSEGGVIAIPAAGFRLTIPPKAVSQKTRFSVTALKGKLVAYEFAPHGLKFNVPLLARQDLDETKWKQGSSSYNPNRFKAGYFTDASLLSQINLTALVSELLYGYTDYRLECFWWPIPHFSGYIVAE